MKVLVFVANGSEDSELVTTVDLLKRAGIDTTLCSLNKLNVVLSHGFNIVCDTTITKLKIDDALSYDGLFLPGGMKGVNKMLKTQKLLDVIKLFNFNHKMISAICAAPKVLSLSTVLDYKMYTCYDGCNEGIDKAVYMDKKSVVRDDNIITGRSLNYSVDFALEIINYLLGEAQMNNVSNQILR